MIVGRSNLNRAIQGDKIVVQLLPKSQWLRTPTAVIVEEGQFFMIQDLKILTCLIRKFSYYYYYYY